MRTQQVLVLEKKDSLKHYASWQSCVNECLKNMTKMEDTKDVRILFMNESMAVLTYFLNIEGN